MSETPENWWKSMKIANIDREIFHNFWTTWGVSMKFSGKMWLMIKLKPGFPPLFRRYIFRKTTGRVGQIDPTLPAVLGLKLAVY